MTPANFILNNLRDQRKKKQKTEKKPLYSRNSRKQNQQENVAAA